MPAAPLTMFDALTTRRTLLDAFLRVQENGGCRGADGMTVARFAACLDEELDRLQDRLLRGLYRPFPLLRFEIPKATSGLRRLTVPTVRDRVVQTAVYSLTREIFEAEYEETSYAYRLGRSVKDAVRRVAELRDLGFRFVLDADVDAFFDNIPHERLLARVGRLGLPGEIAALLAGWVRAEVYDGRRVFRLDKGIPQGSVVSPMLANLFLDELDENLALFGQSAVRYGDDFVVLCRDPRQAQEALELTDYLLAELELRLQPDKTRVTSFEQGFTFLGAIFLKNDVYLPFDRHRPPPAQPSLPPPLDLWTYLELRGEAASWPPST